MKNKNIILFKNPVKTGFNNIFLGCLPILFSIFTVSISAQSDGLKRGANQMPYDRYESENSNKGGGSILHGPTYDMQLLASEATDRKFVSLNSKGSYVEWTVSKNNQNGLTLRYSLPDNNSGVLALYINDQKVRDIELTTYWAWQYFDVDPDTDGSPTNTPQGNNPEPRMRFDELHFILSNGLNSGDVIKLQKDTNDGIEYAVDFIELESVPAPKVQPAGYINIMDYGAIPNDDINDAKAFRTAFDTANGDPNIKGVYIPAGRFLHGKGNSSPNGNFHVSNKNLSIMGAGMWHTEIYFSVKNENGAGFLFDANAIALSDVYLNSATNTRTAGNKAVSGTLGKGSTIKDVWIEHFESGFWITSVQNNGQWNVTDGLIISNCRVRNIYGDGTNLTKGTSNTTVKQISYRNCVDDAMAVWSVNHLEPVPSQPSTGNIFSNNTVENNLRSAGIGFFGGHSHKADHLLIKDSFAGPGIRVNTQYPAYPFGSNASQSIDISETTIIGAGTSKNIWTYRFGAIDLELSNPTAPAEVYSLQYLNFKNIDVIDSQHDAVFIHSYLPILDNEVLDNVLMTNVNINGTGVALNVNYGSQFTTGTGESGGHAYYAAYYDLSPENRLKGWVQLTGGSFNNIKGEEIAYFNVQPEFEIRKNMGEEEDTPKFAIQSVWNQLYLKDDGDEVGYGRNPKEGNIYLWTLEELDNGNVEIKNVETGDYMHVQDLTGNVQSTPRQPGWESARWVLKDTGEESYWIQNVQQVDNFIHIENSVDNVELGPIFPTWETAKWLLKKETELSINDPVTQEIDSVKIYPNPASEKFVLDLLLPENSVEGGSYNIYNTSGKLVATAPIVNTRTSVLIGGLAAGVYIVNTQSSTFSKNLRLVIK